MGCEGMPIQTSLNLNRISKSAVVSWPTFKAFSFWTFLFFLFMTVEAYSQDSADTGPEVIVRESPSENFEDPFADIPEEIESVQDLESESFEEEAQELLPSEEIPILDEEPREIEVPVQRPEVGGGFTEEPVRRPVRPEPLPEIVPAPDLESFESDDEFLPRPDSLRRGPVSEDFERREKFLRVKRGGSWNLMADFGAGFGLNRRPGQIELQLEGGYRVWRMLDLNGTLQFRLRGDRILGFHFQPTWTWARVFGETERFDVRAGMGLGWTLRGVRGSDFQIGYLSARPTGSLFYYFTPGFSLGLSLDVETWLFRVETGGQNSSFELTESAGPSTQVLTSLGFRFEFD